MTDIKLGQSIAGSLTTTDAKIGSYYYDDYDLPGLDSFRQLAIEASGSVSFQLINSATGAIINGDNNYYGKGSVLRTTFPGINYKIRVSSSNLGDYKLSLTDGGKATSILTRGLLDGKAVGTVGTSGEFFPLATGSFGSSLTDVALAPNGQFYTILGGYSLNRIDPSVAGSGIAGKSLIKDTQGNRLNNLNALEFAADNKLYAIGGDRFYQIDVNTNIATLKANLPLGFTSSGDLVYDTANNRFLATSQDTVNSDALWQISAGNPSVASKIGSIGFTGVEGLSFENGQLTGFSTDGSSVNKRIKIDINNGKGTFDKDMIGVSNVLGASTVFDFTPPTPTTPPTSTTPTNPITINPIAEGRAEVIGNKSQTATQRTIDLTDYQNKTLKVDITTKGDAAYNNNVGFYTVEDSLGTIKLSNGITLKPGDVNYAVEAIRNAVKNAGLYAGKNDTKLNQDIVGGQIYAPVVVAQGSLDDFINKNPTNGGGGNNIHAYFDYIGANSDKFDHFRLSGSNIFSVEDQYGGGDKDFNDLVVNMNIRTV